MKVISNAQYGVAPAAYRELAVLQTIKNQYVVQLIDVYAESDNTIFIYENAGISLSQFISQLKQKQSKISCQQRILIAYQILEALNAFHQAGYAHNDVKPQNIMINQNCQCKLIDFGLSGKDFTQQGTMVYQNIQQMWGQQNDQVQFNPMMSDIFQFGITYLNMALNLDGDTEHIYSLLNDGQQQFSQLQILKLQQHFIYFDPNTPLNGIKETYLQLLFKEEDINKQYNLEELLRQNIHDISDLEIQLLKNCLIFQPECRQTAQQLLTLLNDVQVQQIAQSFMQQSHFEQSYSYAPIFNALD